jgi:hypothetical protein
MPFGVRGVRIPCFGSAWEKLIIKHHLIIENVNKSTRPRVANLPGSKVGGAVCPKNARKSPGAGGEIAQMCGE